MVSVVNFKLFTTKLSFQQDRCCRTLIRNVGTHRVCRILNILRIYLLCATKLKTPALAMLLALSAALALHHLNVQEPFTSYSGKTICCIYDDILQGWTSLDCWG